MTGLLKFHHVRLPVRNLDRSLAWYCDLFGFERDFPFRQDGRLYGWALRHPSAMLDMVLIEDPEKAEASAGFPYFSFLLKDEETMRALMARLDEAAVPHEGMLPALAGFKLPGVRDPDGHIINFYMAGERTRTPT